MAAELSSAGWRKPVGEQYPAEPLLARFAAHGVPFTTASDAHRPRARGRPGRRPARPCSPRSASTSSGPTAAGRPTVSVAAWPRRPPGGDAEWPPRPSWPSSTPTSAPDELEHLQRLLGSWSVLADLSLLGPLLLVPVSRVAPRPRGGEPELVVLGQIRPNNRPTLVEQDLVGQTVGRVGAGP